MRILDPRTPCFMCKINDSKLQVLQRLDQLTCQVKAKDGWCMQWMWDIGIRCKYGIGNCQDIHQLKDRCYRLVQNIEPRLVIVAEEDNERLYRDAMSLIRGNFPQVFHEMEHLHARKRRILNGSDYT